MPDTHGSASGAEHPAVSRLDSAAFFERPVLRVALERAQIELASPEPVVAGFDNRLQGKSGEYGYPA